MSSSVFQTVNIQRILTRYGMTTYLTLGDIGLILNIIIFSQTVHRRNTCSIYILATSLSSLIGLNSAIIPVMYSLDHRNPYHLILYSFAKEIIMYGMFLVK
jgi:hypothetical protein